MLDFNKELAEELYNLLSSKLTWDSYRGVVEVKTPYFVGLTHTFPLMEKQRVIRWKAMPIVSSVKRKNKKKAPARRRKTSL